jgi:hypothetical protein
MKIWMELISRFPERAGQYLIAPINSETKKNYPIYGVIKELDIGDLVFHCVLNKASGQETSITSYSFVASRYQIQEAADSMCFAAPPYRKVFLGGLQILNMPITQNKMRENRAAFQRVMENELGKRMPFDKNFNLKQLYLSRIPDGFIPIFELLSATKIQR